MTISNLRTTLESGEFVSAPGIHDMISAVVANKVGFDFIYSSGFWGTASVEGIPDAGISTYTEMLNRVATLCRTSNAGVIADAEFFAWLEKRIDGVLQRDPDALAVAITACCEIKAKIVAEDEREAGKRALLNREHPVACPRCASLQTEVVSEFGSTACKASYKCIDCLEPFEYFKCI